MRTISRRFTAIDLAVGVLYLILYFSREIERPIDNLFFEVEDIFTSIVIKFTIALLLAVSAYLLSRFIKT